MKLIVKVFDISTEVKSNSIGDKQQKNILKIFDELSEETHLITNCFLNLESEIYKDSPIYHFNKAANKVNFNYKKIADDLLEAECKADNTRNSTNIIGTWYLQVH